MALGYYFLIFRESIYRKYESTKIFTSHLQEFVGAKNKPQSLSNIDASQHYHKLSFYLDKNSDQVNFDIRILRCPL